MTRTLISLNFVSKLTYQAAKKLLFGYCLHIDSDKLLYSLTNNITDDILSRQSWHVRSALPVGLILSPFSDDSLEPTIVKQLDKLSSRICGSLVLDMPLRFLFPEDDQ